MFALHTAWRIDVEGRSIKNAAIDGGCESSGQLGNYLIRQIGRRPIGLRQEGFWLLLDRFLTMLALPESRSHGDNTDCAF